MDDELEKRLDDIDAAIDRLFELHGMMSPRLAAQRPQHLRDPGADAVEVVGGHIMVKP
jgi:hypothetical protein